MGMCVVGIRTGQDCTEERQDCLYMITLFLSSVHGSKRGISIVEVAMVLLYLLY